MDEASVTARRILVVEDDDVVRMTLVAGLELEGFHVTEASGGEAALALLVKESFDLVLSDIRMPGMDGAELLRRVKEILPELPVVLMTAYASEDLVRDATQKGVFTVLTKPFELSAASSTLARAIARPMVLIVDDTEPFATSLAEALQASGIRAQATSNGGEALALVSEHEVDVCVVDLVLSGTTGAELVRDLLAHNPSLIMIAVSGHSVPELITEALENGARQFMRKPLHPADLLRLIAKVRAEPGRGR